MSWSKVRKGKKPLMWWYHKLLCELGYWIEFNINGTLGMRMYYKHLDCLCSYGFNLYGEKIKNNQLK